MYLWTSKKAQIFLTINQKVFVTQEERLEEEVKEKKTFQVRNWFILLMNQQKVAQKQQSNVPFHFEKNGEKCKMKDLTVLSIETKRGERNKKERQEEGEYQHHNHHAPQVHLPVPWFFLQ